MEQRERIIESLQRAVHQLSETMDLIADDGSAKCKSCHHISQAFALTLDSLLDVQQECLTALNIAIAPRPPSQKFEHVNMDGTPSHPSAPQAISFHDQGDASRLAVPISSDHVCQANFTPGSMQPNPLQSDEELPLSNEDQGEPSKSLHSTKPWSPDSEGSAPPRPSFVPKLDLHVAIRRNQQRWADGKQQTQQQHSPNEHNAAQCVNQDRESSEFAPGGSRRGSDKSLQGLDAYLQLLMPTMWKPLRGWALQESGPRRRGKANATAPRRKSAGPVPFDSASMNADGQPQCAARARSPSPGAAAASMQDDCGGSHAGALDPTVAERVPSTPSRPCVHPAPRNAEDAWQWHKRRMELRAANLNLKEHPDCNPGR